MTTYICDECGYQAAERAQVLAHLRAEHGIVDAGEVGQVAQHDGLLILREGGQETVIDLDAWVRAHLGASRPAGQRGALVEGQAVICNGQRGTVARVLGGPLAGMVEVRLAGGLVCVPARWPDCYPADEAV